MSCLNHGSILFNRIRHFLWIRGGWRRLKFACCPKFLFHRNKEQVCLVCRKKFILVEHFFLSPMKMKWMIPLTLRNTKNLAGADSIDHFITSVSVPEAHVVLMGNILRANCYRLQLSLGQFHKKKLTVCFLSSRC